MTHILARARLFRMIVGGYWLHHKVHGWHQVDAYRYRHETLRRTPSIIEIEDNCEYADATRVLALIALLSGVVMAIVVMSWKV